MKTAIDAGGSSVKVYNGRTLHAFPSAIGYDWRERRIETKHGAHDLEWSYNGMKGFATLSSCAIARPAVRTSAASPDP